jgi:chromate reductase, NAD(P)H dehydrogenase (quinone)
VQILAISGSLRSASVCTALRTAATLTPYGVTRIVYDGLGDLPHFNPELDKDPLPLAVTDFRSQLNSSAGVITSSPEYAHGIPGLLKNALDWLVARGELYDKPVALFKASSRGRYAQASLTETLTVMRARLIPEASINPSFSGMANGESSVVSSADISRRVELALAALIKAIGLPRPERGPSGPGYLCGCSQGHLTTAHIHL